MSFIQTFLKQTYYYLYKLFFILFNRLTLAGQKIPFEDKVQDFNEVFKTTRFYLFFNLLALLIFIFLPQGKDVILIVIEDLSTWHFGSLISLVVGLLFWCVFSEFGARYKVYVTDNSGLSLTDERVNYRKQVQKFVSTVYLLIPVVIVIISVISVSVINIKTWQLHDIWPFAGVLFMLVLLFVLLSRFYLDEEFINKLREKGVWYKVDATELKWAERLYGIYNDRVFMLHKPNAFLSETQEQAYIKHVFSNFTEQFENLPHSKNDEIENGTVESFPREYVEPDGLAPLAFSEVEFKESNTYVSGKTVEETKGGYFRWIYKNNPAFYKTLHKQVAFIGMFSFLVLILISFNFLLPYEFIGSPGLVCLSFACWVGIYTGLLYIDSRYRKQFKISVRWMLMVWFFIVSFKNNDHPVRSNEMKCCNARPTLTNHFDQWFTNHLSDTTLLYTESTEDSINHPMLHKREYPVFFITAEGGALRTGAFTAMLLARLQDSFPEFKNHIYAFSTVSGGSVGISYFNAVAYLNRDSASCNKGYYPSVTRKFFAQDQLSPVLAKMFYADLLNDFWPTHIEKFDRAIALEKAWEHSYEAVFGRAGDVNIYSENFLSCFQKSNTPAWFINTTEVETGLQCYLSNVKADSFLFPNERDLLDYKIKNGINYSTAVNFSSRFPLFSPSAAVYQNDDRTYHYIDGGYVENTGAKTMLEIMQSLRKRIKADSIVPYVIQLKFGDTDSSKFQQTGFLNEISSIVNGIYNTREGSSSTNSKLLKEEVLSQGGYYINVPLKASSADIPMSWVFSERSLRNLDSAINMIMHDSTNDLYKYLPCFRKVKKAFIKPKVKCCQ